MSTPPRRRRPDARNAKPEGGGWLPTIAMGLGVIVAGLGIGALGSVFLQRTTVKSPAAAVAIVTSTPAPAPVPARAPVAIATIEPLRSPSPAPSPSASATADPTAQPTPQASPSPKRSSIPSPAATPVHVAAGQARVAIGAPRVAAETPAATPTQRPSTEAPSPATAATPVAPVTAAPTATPVATVAPAAPPAGDSAYDDRASAVVRRYLDALIRGDEKAAYAALGGSGGTLSEQAFLDSGARVVSVKVTRIDASNASVGCEIASAKGHYYATYHVTAASSGPYISQHDYIKV